ncbi:glycoside hydrolase family 95 protein [Pelagicoccus sp. SDUM812003]|uniref:glycoside hydrolase family 95 protein n=1 Tax=Pelagicoccus sp. SDUM812003 TaxID=3041267 RepID=UPI0028101A43|nr:glycoside hydrolase family 95 protein [Pelagicoccus sp. SDUM812003]MDQ8203519.1 glycoside hydrolase family 95 protein [Pelagicoccus sp. SDUM812003]
MIRKLNEIAMLSLLLCHPAIAASDLLKYDEPGQMEPLSEGLPIGNGSIGALIMGRPAEERIVLNNDTLWAGGPYDPSYPEAKEALPEIRRLLFENKHREAQALVQESFLSKPQAQMSYQAMADLMLSFPGHDQAKSYGRQLDLSEAVATVSYQIDGVTYTREHFASAPDGVVVVRLQADRPGSIDVTLHLDSLHERVRREFWPDGFRITGRNSDRHGIDGQLSWSVEASVLREGGWALPGDNYLRIRDADTVTLLIAANTSHVSWKDVSGSPMARNQAQLETANAYSYDELKERHLEDYRSLFERVSLELEGADPELGQRFTDERIATFSQDQDPEMAALYFNFARYLLISSSRPGGQPANLQGLWNDKLFAPWDSKYTININTEMNYWPAQVTQLAECVEPLASMLHDLAESGQRTAKNFYGASGWVTHHNTDLWRATGPIDGAFWGMWPTGGAWLSLFLWERFEFSGDLETLEADYPVLKGAARFFLDTLVEDPRTGYLVTAPSNSPENAHHPGVTNAAGPTMDNAILRDLFSAVVQASEELGVDEAFREEVESAAERLPPFKIGEAGQLQEWQFDWDLEAPERDHRHVSHLYALHPSNQISPVQTPELAKAARKSLELRGDEGTGWSLAWKVNFWARLLEGERAHDLLELLISPGFCYTNMFDAHPPFQIDGNFGGASGVVEMLLQSHLVEGESRVIHLLPALPEAWKEGEIRGFRTRGGFEVDMSWKQGARVSAKIESRLGGSLVVKIGDRTHRFNTDKGELIEVSEKL